MGDIEAKNKENFASNLLHFQLWFWVQDPNDMKSGNVWIASDHCTRIYPIAFMFKSPHVLESSWSPPVPNPILVSQEPQSFSLLPRIPILALEWRKPPKALNPSLLQSNCKLVLDPTSVFYLSLPSEVAWYFPSAITEYRESACLLMTTKLSCWPIFIPWQILVKDVVQ